MKSLPASDNFLGIEEKELYEYEKSEVVIQQVPYEHTSSYLTGSAKGPKAIVDASRFVEFYDEELDDETYKKCGIATLPELDFKNKVDADAIAFIENETDRLIRDNKFVVSIGAEHTVTLGFVKAHAKKYQNLCVLQIDAHSDLRSSYHGNVYSHASVMARVHDLGIPITQIGIRAQCKEESDLIKASNTIHTFYAHEIRNPKPPVASLAVSGSPILNRPRRVSLKADPKPPMASLAVSGSQIPNPTWMDDVIATLSENVYLTIDADGFDPAVIPGVGTAEPNGLFWVETLTFLRKVFEAKNVVGFDVVECAPIEGQILSEYTLAKLIYRLIGYKKNRK